MCIRYASDQEIMDAPYLFWDRWRKKKWNKDDAWEIPGIAQLYETEESWSVKTRRFRAIVAIMLDNPELSLNAARKRYQKLLKEGNAEKEARE